jgi:hypothetical protein
MSYADAMNYASKARESARFAVQEAMTADDTGSKELALAVENLSAAIEEIAGALGGNVELSRTRGKRRWVL